MWPTYPQYTQQWWMMTKSILLGLYYPGGQRPSLSCPLSCVQYPTQCLVSIMCGRKEWMRARWQAGRQQATEWWYTDPFSFMQRRLALQNPCPSTLHSESTLIQGQRMKQRSRAESLGTWTCVCMHIFNSSWSHSQRAPLCAFSKMALSFQGVPMYSSPGTRLHGYFLPDNLWICTVSWIFFRSYMRVHVGWLCVWEFTSRLGQGGVYMSTHIHACGRGQCSKIFPSTPLLNYKLVEGNNWFCWVSSPNVLFPITVSDTQQARIRRNLMPCHKCLSVYWQWIPFSHRCP